MEDNAVRELQVGTADSSIISILKICMVIAFTDLPTFCDHYDTFFIQIRSVEAELLACEDW